MLIWVSHVPRPARSQRAAIEAARRRIRRHRRDHPAGVDRSGGISQARPASERARHRGQRHRRRGRQGAPLQPRRGAFPGAERDRADLPDDLPRPQPPRAAGRHPRRRLARHPQHPHPRRRRSEGRRPARGESGARSRQPRPARHGASHAHRAQAASGDGDPGKARSRARGRRHPDRPGAGLDAEGPAGQGRSGSGFRADTVLHGYWSCQKIFIQTAREWGNSPDIDWHSAYSIGEVGALDAREAVRHARPRRDRRAPREGAGREGRGPEDLRRAAAGAGGDPGRGRGARDGADELLGDSARDRAVRRAAQETEDRVTFTDEFVELDGCRTHLRRGGKGKPLLYLHGASGAPVIQPFMEKLAERFDVLVPEHPGYGQSGEPEWLENMHDLAYFYLDFLKKLKLEKVFISGSSIGGWLALEMAVRDTSRIASMVLIGPAGIKAP